MASHKLAHLEMIQGVINRLARNSFLLKGWSVVLISAIFALAIRNTGIFLVYVAFFPAVVFWGLDGYFLWQERLFRALYDYARALPEDQIDFSMDVTSVTANVASWERVTFSKTLVAFHGAILLTIIIITIISILAL